MAEFYSNSISRSKRRKKGTHSGKKLLLFLVDIVVTLLMGDTYWQIMIVNDKKSKAAIITASKISKIRRVSSLPLRFLPLRRLLRPIPLL